MAFIIDYHDGNSIIRPYSASLNSQVRPSLSSGFRQFSLLITSYYFFVQKYLAYSAVETKAFGES